MVGCVTNAELSDQCSGWMAVTSGPHSLHGLHMHNLLQVLSSYREEGFGFLVKVFNSSDHLEQLTGLHLLYSAADRADVSCLLAHMGGEGCCVCCWFSVACSEHVQHTGQLVVLLHRDWLVLPVPLVCH